MLQICHCLNHKGHFYLGVQREANASNAAKQVYTALQKYCKIKKIGKTGMHFKHKYCSGVDDKVGFGGTSSTGTGKISPKDNQKIESPCNKVLYHFLLTPGNDR